MFLLGQTVGKYQILSNLGSGGFGTVFLAKDVWIDKKVAIKVPHRQSGDEGELLQEPRLLAALDHANIVGIVTAERVDGVFFIVMEDVKGESLEAVLDRKPTPAEDVLNWRENTVIWLTRAAGENIDIYAGGALFGFGEIVVTVSSLSVAL